MIGLAFLNDMCPEWKQKYIKSFIPVGSPFGGTLMNVLGAVSGYNLGIPLNPAALRDFEALSPTGPWLFPRPCQWNSSEVSKVVCVYSINRHKYSGILTGYSKDPYKILHIGGL